MTGAAQRRGTRTRTAGGRRVFAHPSAAAVLAAPLLISVFAAGATACSSSGSPAASATAVATAPPRLGTSATTTLSSTTTPAPTTPATATPAPSAQSSSAAATVGPLLTGLPRVPAGFTLPPGSVLARRAVTGATSQAALSSPPVDVAVAYLRTELAALGYRQLLTRTTGTVTAYAYRRGTSVIGLSGWIVDGAGVTGLAFSTD